ncbi:hypothetical protein BJ170DRAFT_692371 [Xylariales sp. AK1849]|nr:hypothetical protein BJ170DRAFT_692371 [Xylariales sp. AK1849]
MDIRTLRIAMLNTDMPVPNVRARMGTYGTIFHKLLAVAATRISSVIKIDSTEFDVVLGEYPEALSEFDAILITGSASSAYDAAEWIQRLDNYSLFKHIGVRVEKDPKGWELGVQAIQLTNEFDAALGSQTAIRDSQASGRPPTPPDIHSGGVGEEHFPQSSSRPLRLQFVHADHVKLASPGTLPNPWVLVGSTKHCAVQGVYEPHRVLTFQGHFEFDKFVNTETVKVFGASWEPGVLEGALRSMDADDDAERAAEMVVMFLMENPRERALSIRGNGLSTPPVEII